MLSFVCCNGEYREKPGDEDFVKLDQMKIPYLLNFAQCQLLLNDFYPAIEHTTEVLKRDPGSLFDISLTIFCIGNNSYVADVPTLQNEK